MIRDLDELELRPAPGSLFTTQELVWLLDPMRSGVPTRTPEEVCNWETCQVRRC
jgi:hypothetical protein